MERWIQKLLQNEDLGPLLFWAAFILLPILARVVQGIRRSLSDQEKARTSTESSSKPARDLEREGREAWKRLLEGDEEAAEIPPPAQPRLEALLKREAQPQREAVSLEELGAGLERAARRPVSLESASSESIPARESGALGSELPVAEVSLEAVPPSHVREFTSLQGLAPTQKFGERLPGEPAPGAPLEDASVPVEESRTRVLVRLASSEGGADWKAAFVFSEVLGAPLALRPRPGGIDPFEPQN